MTGDDYGPMGPGRRGWDRDDVGWDMHDGIDLGWGGWLLLGLLFLLLVGLVVAGVVLLLRSLNRTSPEQAGGPPSEQILDERFARGEIDEEEYLRRRSVLRGGPPGPAAS